MHATTALIVALLFFRLKWLASLSSKLVAAGMLALLLNDYANNLRSASGFLRAFTPGLTSQDPEQFVSLVYLLVLVVLSITAGVLCQFLLKKFKHVHSRDVSLGVAMLAAYMILTPAVPLLSMLPAIIQESRVQAPTFPPPKTTASPDKPDIYYIVLDRYTNNKVLKEQLNYDNTPFTNFLQDNGFVVNQSATANYPYTAMSVSSTMAAAYTNDLVAPYRQQDVQSHTLYHNIVWQSPVIKAVKAAGYNYYNIGSTYGTSYKAPLAERDYGGEYELSVFGAQLKLQGVEAVAFSQSPYYSFAQNAPNGALLKATDLNDVDRINRQLNILEQTSREKPGGRFIFAHMLIPHDPYFFNADGSLAANPEANSVGKPIKQKYIEQVQYVNNQMQSIISSIKKHSGGKAIIVMNADEGPYPHDLNSTARTSAFQTPGLSGKTVQINNMLDWPDAWLQMKFGILQAVHMPDANSEDLQHLSSVNVFRIVLNRYFGYSLPYLPQCHFGLTKGNRHEYIYADITNRLENNASPDCRALQSL